VETIWALLLPAELRFSWWKWSGVHGLSLCAAYPATALKELNQLHNGEMYFYLPLAQNGTYIRSPCTYRQQIMSPNASEVIRITRERQKSFHGKFHRFVVVCFFLIETNKPTKEPSGN